MQLVKQICCHTNLDYGVAIFDKEEKELRKDLN